VELESKTSSESESKSESDKEIRFYKRQLSKMLRKRAIRKRGKKGRKGGKGKGREG